MLLVYKFETSAVASVTQQVVTYCFHTIPPVPAAGLTLFYHARLSVNTASFSPPTNSNSTSSPRGFFYPDPKEHIITLEVSNGTFVLEATRKLISELYVPVRTFLAYIAAHPAATAASARTAHAGACGGPYVDVPWEDWGPRGAHLVLSRDQRYIIRRPRSCGMRVLGTCLSRKSVVVTDYHPGRVALSADGDTSAAARVRARAQDPTVGGGTSLSFSSMRSRCIPPLVRVTKEVPLPAELQNALESPWTMLCEDALVAFEVSGLWDVHHFIRRRCRGWMIDSEGVFFSVLLNLDAHSMSRTAPTSAGCMRIPSDRAARWVIWRTSIGIYYYLSISLSALGKS